jgi:phosphoribosylformylglycinamidine cyclo-ligase
LDYFAVGKLDETVAEAVIRGIGEGCRQAGCALIGGETAEMPGFYAAGEYDLAGFAVGIVDNSRIIDGSAVHTGDRLIGIASSGLHSNGYSLARKIVFELLKLDVDQHVAELGRTVGEELLAPTRIYAATIEPLVRDCPVHALAHITGGGLAENVVRVIPDSCGLRLYSGSWEVPPVFRWLQAAGKISPAEMQRTFNNGIGLIVVVPEGDTGDVIDRLNGMGEKAFLVGEVIKRPANAPRIMWIDGDDTRTC